MTLDSASVGIIIAQLVGVSVGTIGNFGLWYAALRAGLYRTQNERAALIPTIGSGLLCLSLLFTFSISLA